MGEIRLGFIGCGWWATANHLPLLKVRGDVRLVAACGLDREVLMRAQKKFGIETVCTDVRELLCLDLDGVIISSPHALHYDHALAALQSGKHVLCEKPMTLHAADAWNLVRLARASNRILLVAYGWNYLPFLQTAKQWIEEDVLGEIEYLSCAMASPARELLAGTGEVPASFQSDIAKPNLATWQVKELGGGYAHGQITHSVALTLWLTGLTAREVTCQMISASSGIDLYDSAIVRFDCGATGTLSGAATLPEGSKFQIDLRIFGKNGVLLLDFERERLELWLHSGEKLRVDIPAGAGEYSCTGPPNVFVDLIQGSGRNCSSGEIGAATVELVEAMYRSAQQRMTVPVAPGFKG